MLSSRWSIVVKIWAASSFLALLLLAQSAQAAADELPRVGDRLETIPGQPLCSTVDELVLYLRSELGIDKTPHRFTSCGAMPAGAEFIVLEVSADDPELPMRPARIRVVAPGGASVVGWTVLVSDGG